MCSEHGGIFVSRVQVMRLSLCDIHAADGSGRLLGGLVYADTCVALQGQPLVLTDTVPPLLSWRAAGLEDRLASRIDRAVAQVYMRARVVERRGSHGRVSLRVMAPTRARVVESCRGFHERRLGGGRQAMRRRQRWR